MERGQGTIEYLVILAIIVVIALIVVGLLIQTLSIGGGISETQSKSIWKTSEPFAIDQFTQSGTVLTLVVRNNSGKVLTLTDVNIGDFTDTTENDGNSINNVNFAPNEKQVITIDLLTGSSSGSCEIGDIFSFNADDVTFSYDTEDIENLIQVGTGDLTGTCS